MPTMKSVQTAAPGTIKVAEIQRPAPGPRLGAKPGELGDPITRAVARSTIAGLVRRLHPET
jgi:hypothetical protein